VNQQESLQELKQRFMARLQQVGNPSRSLDPTVHPPALNPQRICLSLHLQH